MSIQFYIVLGLAFTNICAIVYLGLTESDRLLGRSWRLSVGTDTAYRMLTQHNIETDRLIKRGMETLAVLERKPIMPRDFNLTSNGHAADFRSPPENVA